jgi:hypothetical protein
MSETHGKWQRTRNRYGYWLNGEQLAYIGKVFQRKRWLWSINIPPYTSGMTGNPTYAKRDAIAALDAANLSADLIVAERVAEFMEPVTTTGGT